MSDPFFPVLYLLACAILIARGDKLAGWILRKFKFTRPL